MVHSACEQCGRLDVPKLHDPVHISDLLANPKHLDVSDKGNVHALSSLLVCDERQVHAHSHKQPLFAWLRSTKFVPNALMVGPEGGFSQAEFALIDAHSLTTTVHVSQNILRAETAALCGLSLLQAKLHSS